MFEMACLHSACALPVAEHSELHIKQLVPPCRTGWLGIWLAMLPYLARS